MTVQSWTGFRKELVKKALLQGMPVTGTFELTARCNFNCVMCYIRSICTINGQESRRELTSQQWLELAEQARDAGMLYALLTGGEVFIRDDFRDIYEGVCDLGIIPTIYTNGSMLNEDCADWLAKRPPELISITLYGASPAMYEKICGVAGAFNQVVENIDRLLDRGLNVELSTTAIRDNKDDYQALVELAGARNLPLRYSSYISPYRTGDKPGIADYRLSPIELKQFMVKAEKEYCTFIQNKNYKASAKKTEKSSKKDPDKRQENSPFNCLGGRTDFWLTWYGGLSFCGLSEDIITDPLKNGFDAAWTQLKDEMKEVPHCEECQGCPDRNYCLACPVRLKNETGSYQKSCDYFCELAKISREWSVFQNDVKRLD